MPANEFSTSTANLAIHLADFSAFLKKFLKKVIFL